jgi:AcrR family transcriptional regulator
VPEVVSWSSITGRYTATRTADLVGELGVNRKSMYAEFGSKQALFEAVLERYDEQCH